MKSLLLALSLTLFTPLVATAQDFTRELSIISNTLNSLDTIQTSFVQYNADGTQSTGTLSMHRPGRLRMEYNERNAPLIIVGGQQIAIYDGPKDISPESYPLRRTPLWLLLKPQVNLTNRENISKTWMTDTQFWVQVFDPNTPEAGQISFYFDRSTLTLKGWISHTTHGEDVHVALGPLKTGMHLSNLLFSSYFETDRRANQ